LQIPDVRTGDDMIDAVVVDEEAVGSEGRGLGAKILHGKGALDRYLSQQKVKDLKVRNNRAGCIFSLKI
jgi:ATP-dependent Clp protease ATP-binding subunit ClpX